MFKIILYTDQSGYSDVGEYIANLAKSIDKDSRIKYTKTRMYLKLLEQNGLRLGEPHIKKLDKEIWELRPLNDRILFVHWNSNEFLLLSHFTKTTRKTPKSEIRKAKKLLKNYQERRDIHGRINVGRT